MPREQEYIRGVLPTIGDALMGLAKFTKKTVYVERTTPQQSLRETAQRVRQGERDLKRNIAAVQRRINAIEAKQAKTTNREIMRRLEVQRATQLAIQARHQQDLDRVCKIGDLVQMDSGGNHVEIVQTSYLKSVRARQNGANPASMQRTVMAGQKLLATDSTMRDMKKELGADLGVAFDETLEEAIEEDDANAEEDADSKTAMSRRVDERVDQLMEKVALRQKSALPAAGSSDAREGASAPSSRDESILKRMARLRI